jgi:hypothetical protein
VPGVELIEEARERRFWIRQLALDQVRPVRAAVNEDLFLGGACGVDQGLDVASRRWERGALSLSFGIY